MSIKHVRRNRPSAGGIVVRATSLTSTRHRADTTRQVDVDNSMSIVGGLTPLTPPYDIYSLKATYEQSNMLRQCVAAYVTNIALYGWEIVAASEDTAIDEDERRELQSFIDSANSDESLTTLHASVVEEHESMGNGYIEVIRDSSRRVSVLRHADASLMRLCPKDPEAIPIQYDVVRGKRTAYVTELKTFRIYVQLVAGKSTYFKEFGDPRKLDYETGKFASKDYKVPLDKEATEILHFRQNGGPYGTPRWINQLPSILGSRESEEVNLRYFEDNTVPPMILSVAGGRLTGDSYRALEAMLKKQGVGKERQNQIMLIEAVAERESLDDKGSTVSLKVDKLSDQRPSDGLFKEYDEANQAKVRSSFRLPPVAVGLSQDVTFACYDEETETLTDRGWVGLTDWQHGMRVAEYDYRNGSVTFCTPASGLLVYDVQDVDMYDIQTEHVDISVTPEHRMLYSCDKEEGWGVSPVEQMVGSHRVYLRSAIRCYAGGTRLDTLEVPDSKYRGGIAAKDPDIGNMDADVALEWIGYYIADGCIAQNGNAVSIGAKKERKVIRFEALHEELQDAGFRVRRAEEVAGVYFTVSHKGFATWLASNAGHDSSSKRIPGFVWELPAAQMAVLFDALMACDGTWDVREGRNSGAYSTVSCQLADDVQRLAFLLGYRALIRQDRPGSFGTKAIYRVLLSNRETTQIYPGRHVSRRSYTGKVYCFSVPTGVFVTRRRGKISLQGNTANVSTFIAETQVYAPARALFDEVYNKRLVNSQHGLNLKTVCLRSRAPAITNPETLIKSLTALNVMGAVTPRTALRAANKILQIELPLYPEKGEEGYEPWMDKPIIFSAKGQSGNTGIDPNGAGNTHDTQAIKDAKQKQLEAGGNVSFQSPENGQQ